MASGTAFDGRTMTLNDGKLLPNFGSSVAGFLAGGETGRGGWLDCSGIGMSFFLYCATKLETDLLLIGTAIAGATCFLAASLTTGALGVVVVATLGCACIGDASIKGGGVLEGNGACWFKLPGLLFIFTPAGGSTICGRCTPTVVGFPIVDAAGMG